MKLYADENVPKAVVEALRAYGHDVLTAFEAGQANQGIPDNEVLAFANGKQRAVLTLNRSDFVALHKMQPCHAGIVVCKADRDSAQLAGRIESALQEYEELTSILLRVGKG